MGRFLDGATRTRANAAIGELVTASGFMERMLAFFVKTLTGKEPKPGAARSVTIVTQYIEVHHPQHLEEWLRTAESIRASRKLRNAFAHSYVDIASSVDDGGIPLVILKKSIGGAETFVPLDEIDALTKSLRNDTEAALRTLSNIVFKGAQATQ